MELKSILLVDDNPNDLELMLEALDKINLSDTVITLGDGVAALDYLYRRGEFQNRAQSNPAVIFLDIKMPRIGGLEVLQTIKSDPELKTIPVVILTSSREEKDIIESYKLGANSFVMKPAGFDQYVDAMTRLGYFWAVINEPPVGSIKKIVQ